MLFFGSFFGFLRSEENIQVSCSDTVTYELKDLPEMKVDRWVFALSKPVKGLKRFLGVQEKRLMYFYIDYRYDKLLSKKIYETRAFLDDDTFKLNFSSLGRSHTNDQVHPEGISQAVYEVCERYQPFSDYSESICDEVKNATKRFLEKHKEAFSKEPSVDDFK